MEIKPGEWHGERREDSEADEILRRVELGASIPFDPKKVYENAQPYFSDDLINIYRFFQEKFGVPSRVFYPCCDLDASPVRAFPNSEVVLLDKNEAAIEALKRNGIDAIAGDVGEYVSDEKFDLLILLNPAIKTKKAIHTLRRGGHILANDYHGNTTQMLNNPVRYQFQGTIHHGKDPMEMLSIKKSRILLKETDPFFNLYSIFRKRV